MSQLLQASSEEVLCQKMITFNIHVRQDTVSIELLEEHMAGLSDFAKVVSGVGGGIRTDWGQEQESLQITPAKAHKPGLVFRPGIKV